MDTAFRAYPGIRRFMQAFPAVWSALCIALAGLAFGVMAAAPFVPAQAQEAGGVASLAAPLPAMRHVDAELARMTVEKPKQITFLLPEDFPPFSYRDRNGALAGLAVAVGKALCSEAKVACAFRVRPFGQLAAALEAGEGDVVLAGLRPVPRHFARFDFTRPYLKALGRFAVRREAAIALPTGLALAGRRVGVVKGTVHDAWLTAALPRARIHRLHDLKAAQGALKAGKVDALFGDWLQLAFWVRGAAAEGCCRLLPGWFGGRMFGYNHHAMAVKRGRRALRDFLDKVLDEMQANGRLEKLIRRHLPVRPALMAPRAEKAGAPAGRAQTATAEQ